MTAAVVGGRHIELLNASYEPLGKLTMQKAVRLLSLGKAVVHQADESGRKIGEWAYPKVLRLTYYVRINYKSMYGVPQLTKRGILLRDNFKCAYCGKAAKTLDHITPRSRGGANSWMNLVSSCFPCNNKKDDRTPEEAKMPLLFVTPRIPTRAELMGIGK